MEGQVGRRVRHWLEDGHRRTSWEQVKMDERPMPGAHWTRIWCAEGTLSPVAERTNVTQVRSTGRSNSYQGVTRGHRSPDVAKRVTGVRMDVLPPECRAQCRSLSSFHYPRPPSPPHSRPGILLVPSVSLSPLFICSVSTITIPFTTRHRNTNFPTLY